MGELIDKSALIAFDENLNTFEMNIIYNLVEIFPETGYKVGLYNAKASKQVSYTLNQKKVYQKDLRWFFTGETKKEYEDPEKKEIESLIYWNNVEYLHANRFMQRLIYPDQWYQGVGFSSDSDVSSAVIFGAYLPD